MTGFWQTELGMADGNPDNAFTQDFGLIPDGTKAFARIEDFSVIQKPSSAYGAASKIYEVKWVIAQGDYVGRIIFQKIRCFDEDEKKRFKALNMLRLIMNLSDVPAPNVAPDNYFLSQMVGKVLGIKIKEYSMPKSDGSGGLNEGNFISEVHAIKGFVEAKGKKLEIIHSLQKEDDVAF
jgi:hypothetical protein